MKHLKIALALSITISLLSGCSNGTPDSWKFSKEDVDNFMVVDSQLIKPDENDSKVKIIRITQAELLKESISGNDYFVFDYNALSALEKPDDYYTYENYRDTHVNVIKTELDRDEYTIDVYFEGSDEGIYGAIFNKEATVNEGFLLTVPEDNAVNNTNKLDLDKFERLLLETPNPKADQYGYMDLVVHFGKLIGNMPQGEKLGENDGPPSGDPKWGKWDIFGAFLGILGILLQIAQWIWAACKGTFYEYLQNFGQLNQRIIAIDNKLNNISSMLTNQFSALLLKADLEEIRSCTTNIAQFKTSYVLPVDNFLRNLSDGLSGLILQALNNGKMDVTIKYTKGADDNKLYPISKLLPKYLNVDVKKDVVVHFVKSKDYLEESKEMNERFGELFLEDIMDSTKGQAPAGISDKEFAQDVFSMIIENFIEQIFSRSENYLNLADTRNLLINYMKQLYSDDLAIITKYANRCKLSYNFGCEVENSLKSTLAYCMFELERNAALAQLISRFSGDVQELNLQQEYIRARDCIREAYYEIKGLPSNYCFRTSTTMSTRLFRFSDNVVTHNFGTRFSGFSHTLKTEILYYERTRPQDKYGSPAVYDRSAHPWADSIALKSVSARFHALNNGGEFGEKKISLIDYFHKIPKLIAWDCNRYIYPNATFYGKNNVIRFMGDFSTRFASKQDKDTKLYCNAYGHKLHNPYFWVGGVFNYLGAGKGKAKEEHWKNGTFYTADILDGQTGEFKNQQDLLMYCDYLQWEKGWVAAENWAFSGGLSFIHPRSKNETFVNYVFGLGVELGEIC